MSRDWPKISDAEIKRIEKDLLEAKIEDDHWNGIPECKTGFCCITATHLQQCIVSGRA